MVGYEHAMRLLPSQLPTQAGVPSVLHAAWPVAGAPVTGEQVPTRLLGEVMLQASHCPVQAVSQQILSGEQ